MNSIGIPEQEKIEMDAPYQPVLKVVGLGGGGCNAVARMMELGLGGLQFIAANTDHQALLSNPADIKIQLGPKTTRGLGAGSKPDIGKAAAEESWRELAAAMKGADMIFLTAGMGGGTGTGSIPIAAKIARSLGAVTIAIVTTPFSFEMGRRQQNASQGLERLRRETHTLISIPNDRLLEYAPRDLPMEVAFHLADDVLRQSVEGISELITRTGMINVDFAHIRRLIQLGGGAIMAIGHGQGDNKVLKAVEQALNHPLLGSVSIENAAGVIANFTGSEEMTLNEIYEAMNFIQTQTGPQTDIVMGALNDDQMDGRVQVTLVITGLGAPTLEEAMSSVQKASGRSSAIRESEAVPEKPREYEPRIPRSEPAPTPQTATPKIRSLLSSQELSAAASQNLDLPAFLRRQSRLTG
jgi:cell division protein FtsZ